MTLQIVKRMSSSSKLGVKDNELGTPVDYASFKPEVAAETPSVSPQFDVDFTLVDPNVQKTGDLITLKYTNKQWITQPLASRVENVNPFNMVDYVGQVTLSPSQDTWTRTVTIDGGTRFQTVGTTGAGGTFVSFTTALESILPDTHIRSRNVAFDIVTLRPLARYYSFFDSSSNLDIIPKLTEITMTSGVFQAGETVKGFVGDTQLFSARIANPNHKSGPIQNPDTVYSLNVYDRSVTLPSVYSASSTVLNIDINSLMEDVLGEFNGRLTVGMVLLGETSGAQASVSDIRLIADTFGDLQGSFFLETHLPIHLLP